MTDRRKDTGHASPFPLAPRGNHHSHYLISYRTTADTGIKTKTHRLLLLYVRA